MSKKWNGFKGRITAELAEAELDQIFDRPPRRMSPETAALFTNIEAHGAPDSSAKHAATLAPARPMAARVIRNTTQAAVDVLDDTGLSPAFHPHKRG